MAFLGLDTDQYPGDAMMARLRQRFAVTGFYLAPAPSHGDTGWMTRLQYLQGLRYGFLPVYVGQELVGPGRHNVTAGQGVIDGADAARLARLAGFMAGSCIYLDLENGPPFTPAEAEYVKAFADTLRTNGYAIGIYGSHLYAAALRALVPEARIWTVHTATVDRHVRSSALITAPDPTSIYSQAIACQFDLSVLLSDFGGLEVDLNSTTIADPSRP